MAGHAGSPTDIVHADNDLDPTQGEGHGQGHRTFELPKIAEAVHAGGDDRQPPYGAFSFLLWPPYAIGQAIIFLLCL